LFDYQELLDRGALAFSEEVPYGVYTYRYVARAITSGRFTAPPPKVETMYAPEFFGKGVSQALKVE